MGQKDRWASGQLRKGQSWEKNVRADGAQLINARASAERIWGRSMRCSEMGRKGGDGSEKLSKIQ